MIRRLIVSFAFLFITRSVAAAEAEPVILMGHNLTPTTYSLRQNELTAGNYIVGYGLTDQLSLAVSPWLLVNYNMLNLITRFASEATSQLPRFAVELNYFRTVPMLFNWYDQESIFARLTTTLPVASSYALHLSAGYQYFFNHERPFSLRLSPGIETSQTVSASTLSEIQLSDHLGMFLEGGLLGVNYTVPYLHLGGSLFWRESWALFQLGTSRSAYMGEVPEATYGVVWHPEIQLQAYF